MTPKTTDNLVICISLGLVSTREKGVRAGLVLPGDEGGLVLPGDEGGDDTKDEHDKG